MTFCMNVSRFMNLAAIFSLDLESQSTLHYAQLDPHILYCTMLLLSKRPISLLQKWAVS